MTINTNNSTGQEPSITPITPITPLELLDVQARLQSHLSTINQTSTMGNMSFDFEKVFPHTENPAELLGQIDELKRCLDSFRPLTTSESLKLAESFDLEYTYDSNRIEGNSLTLAETQVVLEYGVTIGGKPLLHHIEAVNHRNALVFVKELVTANQPLTPSVALEINRIILKGSPHEDDSGRYRNRRVSISGSRHVPPNYMVVPDRMDELYQTFQAWQESGNHPVEIAADLHFQLVKIHPFVDGNGRTARLTMNLWLMQNGYTIANLSGSMDDRLRYYNALESASVDDNLVPFRTLIYEREKASLIWHLDGLTPDVTAGRGAYYLATIQKAL
jgi:Fic family protein